MTAKHRVCKVDEELGLVFGFSIICKYTTEDGTLKAYYDTDNHCIPENVMLKSTTEFMLTKRINNNDHIQGDAGDVGVVVHSFPLTKEIADSLNIQCDTYGWLTAVKPDAPTLAKFKSGEYKGFSIEGSAVFVDD